MWSRSGLLISLSGLPRPVPPWIGSWYWRPWNSTGFSRRIISRNRVIHSRVRSSGRGKGCPYQPSTTCGPETPTPSTSRPFERWSIVIAVIAAQAGVRAEICMMPVPSRIRSVCAPIQQSGENTSEP